MTILLSGLSCRAMIIAENLCRSYGDKQVVSDLSFHVRKGEVTGLLGPNAAGKSTTMKMLTCFLPPSSGTATVAGIRLDRGDTLAIRRQIGYLPENAPSWGELDVHSHLEFIGAMHQMPKGMLRDRIRETGHQCGLESVMHRRIDELSKGFRQRVGLAASMLHDPAILILDEPTTGLDPNQILEIRTLIRQLGAEKTVLFSSHVLSEVEAVCDRAMILDQGRLLAMGTVDDLTRHVQGGQRLQLHIKGDVQAVLNALRMKIPDIEIEHESDDHIQLFTATGDIILAEATFHAVVAAQAVILEMHPEQARLEDIFHRLTHTP